MIEEQAIGRFVTSHYGNLISYSKPKYNPEKEIWTAELRSDYPRIICDDRSPSQRILKFLSLGRLGEIRLGKDLQPLDSTTSREICIQNLTSLLDMWRERAERIIIMVSSDNIARLNEAQGILAKIGMITTNLLRRDLISEEEIMSLTPKERRKIRRYLKLLEGLDLVRKRNKDYTYGNLFAELQKQTEGDVQEFKTAILSHIIKNRYSALRDNIRITQLEPFIHLNSCYYRPTLEAERILYWKSDSIINRYMKFFGRRSSLRIRYILEELVNVEALKYEDNYYFGNEELFSQMLDLKPKIADLTPPRA